MAKRLVIGLVALGMLAGCGRVAESRLNPINWFGPSETVEADTETTPSDPRPLVAQVTDLRLERVPGGVIVRASGLPERQGFFGAELVARNDGLPEDGVLSYQFRVVPPATATRAGTPQSRELIVGVFLSDQSMAGVRRIRVSGATNALAVSR
ncbi:MAG: hypothetical protein AAF748_09910 [Pseudomonadota bacterium]